MEFLLLLVYFLFPLVFCSVSSFLTVQLIVAKNTVCFLFLNFNSVFPSFGTVYIKELNET